jgi:hypothetical protein
MLTSKLPEKPLRLTSPPKTGNTSKGTVSLDHEVEGEQKA